MMDTLDERVARLSPAKRALLELRLKKNAEDASNWHAIAGRANPGSVPLSFAQLRLWFLDQQDPGNSAYNRTSAARLSGPLNVAALELSFNEIVRRHEVVRTTFISDEGNPAQIINASMKVELPVIDLSELDDNERDARARRLITEEGQHSFDLARGPLLRVTLLRLGAEEHILLLNLHHIITDGWSMGILFKELAALYGAFSAGRPSPLPELTTRYADYAVWQREWIKGEVHDTQLAYWKQQLEGAPLVLEIPTDRTRPALQSFRGAVHSFMLSHSLSDQLKALSQQQGATMFMVLLAAFQVLLSRYTSQEDFVVGTPVANRNRTETEGLIGFFVNVLAMRANLSDDPSFRELVGRVREVTLGAYEHQDVPFEAVVEALQPARSLSHSPLFQVMFTLQNAPFEELELPGLQLTQIGFEYKTAKFDLTLSLVEEAEGIKGRLEYNTDLFDEATVGRMSGHYRTLLNDIVREPGLPLSSLPLSTEITLNDLRVSPNGKPDHRALPVSDPTGIENEKVFIAPRDVVEFRLTKIWENILGGRQIGVRDNFFELGGHSLLAVRLFAKIHKEFGKSIPLASVFREGTVEQQASLLRQDGQLVSLTSLVAIQSDGPKRPLFFVSPTAVLNLVKLANRLGPDQPFYGLQAPGLEDGRSPFTRMDDLVAYYIKEIRGVQPEGPYILGGRCFGGIVAFEMAQQLHAQGQETSLLVIFDSGPPKKGRITTRANNGTKKTPSHYARSLFYHLHRGEFRQVLSNKIEDSAQKLKEAAKKKLDNLHESPQDRRLRRIQEANTRAKSNYFAQVYAGRVTLIQSAEFHAREDKTWHLKWSDLARGGFDSYVVEGTHQSMLEGQHVQFLAERLKACLDAATEVKSGG